MSSRRGATASQVGRVPSQVVRPRNLATRPRSQVARPGSQVAQMGSQVAQPSHDGGQMAALMSMHAACLERLTSLESRLPAAALGCPQVPAGVPALGTDPPPMVANPVVATPTIATPVVSALSTAPVAEVTGRGAGVPIPALSVATAIAGERTGPNQLDDHVSSLSRQKIENNNYVELAGLLPERALHRDEAEQSVVLSKDGVLSVAPKEPIGGKVLGYPLWTQAWNVYMTVYLRKFPDQALQLVKYMDIIRGLHLRGVDWAKYDGAFRRARANWPTHYPWETLNAELFLSAQQSAFRSGYQSSDRRPGQSSAQASAQAVPVGYCKQFHARANFCAADDSCRFRHTCPNCQQAHPVYRCTTKPQAGAKRAWAAAGAHAGPGAGRGAKRS